MILCFRIKCLLLKNRILFTLQKGFGSCSMNNYTTHIDHNCVYFHKGKWQRRKFSSVFDVRHVFTFQTLVSLVLIWSPLLGSSMYQALLAGCIICVIRIMVLWLRGFSLGFLMRWFLFEFSGASN